MYGHHRHSSVNMPFKWCFAVGRWWPTYSGILILCSLINWKKTHKKTQSWTPSDKTYWICAWCSLKIDIEVSNPHAMVEIIGISSKKSQQCYLKIDSEVNEPNARVVIIGISSKKIQQNFVSSTHPGTSLFLLFPGCVEGTKFRWLFSDLEPLITTGSKLLGTDGSHETLKKKSKTFQITQHLKR